MTIIRTVHNKDNPYFLLNRTAAEDDGLSFKAVGIHTYLMSKPDNWTVNEVDLAKRHTDGPTAVRSGLKELKEKGYLQAVQVRDAQGKITGWETHVYEIPQRGEPECGKPTSWITEDIVSNDTSSYEEVVSNEVVSSSSSADADANLDDEGSVIAVCVEQPEGQTPPPPSEAPPSPTWWQHVEALCWVCYGHSDTSKLTKEQKGQLTHEAKLIFTEGGYTLDELRAWYKTEWTTKDWRGQKGQRPNPAHVRTSIASVRADTPEWAAQVDVSDGTKVLVATMLAAAALDKERTYERIEAAHGLDSVGAEAVPGTESQGGRRSPGDSRSGDNGHPARTVPYRSGTGSERSPVHATHPKQYSGSLSTGAAGFPADFTPRGRSVGGSGAANQPSGA